MLSPDEPQSRNKALTLIQVALIGLGVWWVYRPVFHAGWIWDDSLEIYGNYSLHTVRGLRNFWFAPPGLDYFPFKSTLQWVQWHLWQGSPAGYHATNVVLHFLSALLLWPVLGKLGIRHGWLGGLLFAVHPLAVESVAWVSEFKNVLSLTLLLLAMLAWLNYDQFLQEGREGNSPNHLNREIWGQTGRHVALCGSTGTLGGSRSSPSGLQPILPDLPVKKNTGTTASSRPSCSKWYFVSLLMFVLAILSKTSVVMFPVVLLLYGWWRGVLNRKYLLRTVPFFGISLVLGLVTVWFQMNRALQKTAEAAEGLWPRVAVGGKAIVFYFAKAVWPTRELPVYPRWDMTGAAEWGWGAVFVGILVALVCGLWVERLVPRRFSDQPELRSEKRLGTSRSTFRSIVFGLAIFVVNLLPVIGLAPMAYQRISWVADHFAYLPLVAVVGFAVAGVGWIEYLLTSVFASPGRGEPAVPRLRDRWFSGAVVQIGAVVAAIALAMHSHSYARIFNDEKSLWTYTLERNPAAWIGYNNLGIAVRLEGHRAEAIRYYEDALRLRPDFAEAHNDLGVALAEQGKFQEALAQYEAAIRDKPDLADAYNDEGNLLQNMGRLPQAEARLRQALRINPNSPEAHNDMGNVLVRKGQPDAAIQEYQQALRLRPDFAQAMSNLGMTLATLGRIDAAIVLYERALQLQPDYAQAHNNVGVLLSHAGRREEAIAQFRLALHYDPQLREAQENLESVEDGR